MPVAVRFAAHDHDLRATLLLSETALLGRAPARPIQTGSSGEAIVQVSYIYIYGDGSTSISETAPGVFARAAAGLAIAQQQNMAPV